MITSTSTNHNQPRERILLASIVALVAVVASVPFLLGSYSTALLRDAMLFSLLAIALDYLWGKTGVLSFGHAAFFGAGAYGVGVVSTKSGLDPTQAAWIGLLIGIALAIFVSLVIGYFLIFGRVRGPYFTIVTLALAIIADHIITGWSNMTGGNAGLLGVLPLYFPQIGGMAPLSANGQYLLVLAVVCVVTLALWWRCRGRYGSVLKAIEDNELRAQALGHNTSLHLLVVFVVSAAIAALGGGLYASTVGFVAPDIVGLALSTQAIVWVAIGGRGTLIGPILATVFVIWLEQKVSSIDTKLWPLAIGGLFILTVFVFPNGILARVEQAFTRLRGHAGGGAK
jgi:urea transport system permease protein